jgi:hypothetical protein
MNFILQSTLNTDRKAKATQGYQADDDDMMMMKLILQFFVVILSPADL